MKSKVATETTSADAPIGKLHPANSLFLRVHVGSATNGELKYQMDYLTNGQPIITSKQTGQYFTLSWQDILDLAVKAGIDVANKAKP